MLHPTAIIESTDIGEGTKVWAHTHIRAGAKIGCNCTIGEGVYIDTGVVVGDRCRIQNGAQLFSGVEIGNDVLIAPCVVTTNDHFPELPIGDWSHRFKKTVIEDNVSVGANSTIICGVTLGQGCMIGAGSVVTKSVPCQSIVVGNPAKHLKWKNQK